MTPDKVEAALGVLRWYCDVQRERPNTGMTNREALSVLTEALAESRRDAARYRWLRDKAHHVEIEAPLVFMADDFGRVSGALYDESLDQRIDLAMKEAP